MENEKSPQEIANEVLPSTVLLEMKDANGQPHSVGSGFFIGEGEIATNFHVVEGTFEGSAKLFGQDKRYEIEGYTVLDVDNDLIVLKIKNPDKTIVNTPTLSLDDMSSVHIGDVIYAVGNPSGLEGTISDGIISGIRHRDPSQGTHYTRIQITAPISPGSSGGAVLNADGEVIGVSVQVLPSLQPISSQNPQDTQYINLAQNLNFAIPSEYLLELLGEHDPNNITPLAEANLERVTFIDKLGWIGSASYTFPLQNRSSKDVKNVHCQVIFKDEENNEITTDVVVFPWLIPARLTKVVIRLSAYDAVALQLVSSDSIQLLQKYGDIDYDESDINDNATESFLLGLADMLLTNMGYTDYSSVEPHVKRLMENYEIRVVDLEVVE